MAFKYCQSCGYKNQYTLNAPKYCGGCGNELGVSVASTQIANKKAPKKRERFDSEEFDPDGLDVWEVPRINKLSYSVELPSNKTKLSDLIPLEELENFEEEGEAKPKAPRKPKSSRKRHNAKKKKA